MRLVPTLAAVLMAAAGLSACGNDEPADPPNIGGSSSGAAESSPGEPGEGSAEESGAESGAATEETFDDQGHESFPGRVAADDPEEEAVAEAWFAYWRVRADAYGEVKVSADELGKVATGAAASDVVGYVKYLRDNGLHTQGDSLIGISDIKIQGGVAALTSCMQNKSVDRDADGKAAEKLTRHLTFNGVLQRQGDTWVVSEAMKTGESPCRAS